MFTRHVAVYPTHATDTRIARRYCSAACEPADAGNATPCVRSSSWSVARQSRARQPHSSSGCGTRYPWSGAGPPFDREYERPAGLPHPWQPLRRVDAQRAHAVISSRSTGTPVIASLSSISGESVTIHPVSCRCPSRRTGWQTSVCTAVGSPVGHALYRVHETTKHCQCTKRPRRRTRSDDRHQCQGSDGNGR